MSPNYPCKIQKDIFDNKSSLALAPAKGQGSERIKFGLFFSLKNEWRKQYKYKSNTNTRVMQFTRYSGNIFQLQQTDQNNFIYDWVIKKLDVFGDSLTVPKEQCCSKHFAVRISSGAIISKSKPKMLASMALCFTLMFQILPMPLSIFIYFLLQVHTYTRLTALCPGLPGWASTRKVKPSVFYWSKRQWVAVATAGLYASLHLTPDR